MPRRNKQPDLRKVVRCGIGWNGDLPTTAGISGMGVRYGIWDMRDGRWNDGGMPREEEASLRGGLY